MIEPNIEYIVLAISIIYTVGMLYFGHRQRSKEREQQNMDIVKELQRDCTKYNVDMSRMFENCKGSKPTDWDISGVVNPKGMFSDD